MNRKLVINTQELCIMSLKTLKPTNDFARILCFAPCVLTFNIYYCFRLVATGKSVSIYIPQSI